jgi:hypothetical protein
MPCGRSKEKRTYAKTNDNDCSTRPKDYKRERRSAEGGARPYVPCAIVRKRRDHRRLRVKRCLLTKLRVAEYAMNKTRLRFRSNLCAAVGAPFAN